MTTITADIHNLIKSVDGDIVAFEALKQTNGKRLRSDSPKSLKLVVTLDTVKHVLQALQDGRISPQQAQQWASFIRRGYVAGTTRGPVRPLNIEYDAANANEVTDLISRLDELGDLIDGELSAAEISAMVGTRLP
jgi:Trp operon repressor